MYNNTRSKQINERDYTIWSRQSWPSNRFQIPKNWLVWEWLLNWDATDSLWVNNGTATNMSWVDSWVWYTKQAGSFNWTSSKVVCSNITWIKTISLCLTKTNTTTTSNMLFTTNTTWTSNYIWQVHSNWVFYCNLWWWNLTPSHWITANNTWYNIIITTDWSNLKLYNNWILLSTVATTLSLFIWNIWTWNNWYYSWYYYDWLISNIRAYDRVLSNKEIQILYKESLKLLH